MQFYSDPSKENDKWSLPDCEVCELTSREIAEMQEDTIRDYMKRHEFRLASMNSKVMEKLFDTMIEEEGITGGYHYRYCLPGCLPDSDWFGPYKTANEAIEACRQACE